MQAYNKQVEVVSRYESNEDDGERDGGGYEYLWWDHPRLWDQWAACR